MDHTKHLRGRCPRGGEHQCRFHHYFLKDGPNAGAASLDLGLPPLHGCIACGLAAPDPTKEIRFYRATGEFGFLSNLYPMEPPFELIFENRHFRSAEHAYQFGKPKDPDVAAWIRAAPKPRNAAQSGHSLLAHADFDPKTWNAVKVDRMRGVLFAKFGQRPDLAGALLTTGDKKLIEASKSDPFWGLGARGTGKNMLGVLLMEVRQVLIDQGPTTELGRAIKALHQAT